MENTENKQTETASVLRPAAGYNWESKGGKYALKYGENGVLWAYRYGEPWRNLVGDNLILTMLFEIEDMQKLLSDNTKISGCEPTENDKH